MQGIPTRSVAAVGDVADVRCWSGIPFHFLQAARAAGFATLPWRLDLAALRGARRRWNLGQVLRGRRPGGFQYSEAFARVAGAQVPPELFGTEIITFNPHFPPAAPVRAAGGELNVYLDATFAALSSGRGLDLRLPRGVVARGREAERENLHASRRVVTMARWAVESAVNDCGVDPAKVSVILPGANFDLPAGGLELAGTVPSAGRAGQERDFVLGFVGMDWERKGFRFLLAVRDDLARRGWRAVVRAAGRVPGGMERREGVDFVGRINKGGGDDRFFRFLAGCDLGCLFSTNEALGISTLEFLRAGVPVAGFAHQGLLDTLPPDAGFGFPFDAGVDEVAGALDSYLRDEARQGEFRGAACRWSPLVTWERCVAEMRELWETGSIAAPVQLRRTLADVPTGKI